MPRRKKQEGLNIRQDKIEQGISLICDMMRDNDISIIEMVCAMNAVKAGVAMQIQANASDDETIVASLNEIKASLDALLESH